MKVRIEVELGNEGMRTWVAVRDATARAIRDARRGGNLLCRPRVGDSAKIMDANGIAVGFLVVEEGGA